MNQNKQQKRKHIPSIRVKLLAYFICFTTVGLLVLFAFQSLFLEDLYEWLAVRTVRSAVNDVAAALAEGTEEERASFWNVKEHFNVYVATPNGEAYIRKTHDVQQEHFGKDTLKAIYKLASENGGVYAFEKDFQIKKEAKPDEKPKNTSLKKPEKPADEKESPSDKRDDVAEPQYLRGIAYAQIVSADQNGGEDTLVFITSLAVPVYATLRTLQIQFFVAAFVLVLMAGLFSLFVSEKIARPILHLNRAAKQLVGDDYQSPPRGGYLEAAELRQTLDDTATELKKAQQLQKELIANLSHDLRTPLTMITGYSEAIRDFPQEDVSENIQVVIDEANRLTGMVNDILDLSRLQAGTQQIEMGEVDLTQTLHDAVQHFEHLVRSEGYRILLNAEETVMVNANNIRLSQIVYNLLSNALAHAGEDKTVQIDQIVQDKTVRVSVTDHGEGIPAEELHRIWERYYRVRSRAQRPQTDRSGLGLHIVKTLVALHGGECGVESEVGKGSTFWFSLPLYEK